jgi:LDH2 family malate/lactate/ureidoglycolate dehydrogenase
MKGKEMQRYRPTTIKTYVATILERHGVSSDKASITADVLVEADMRGIFSHGVNNFDLLVVNSIKEGGTYPDAVPEDVTKNKSFPIRHIDAHGDLGHPVAQSAVDRVKELATEHGIGKVYVFNANHFGAAAVYSEEICREKHLAGRVTCTTPSVVRPYGGERNRLGTNVISWSLPYSEGVITIDMATTIHAVSGIVKALIEGARLPFPVFDKDGKETTDPGSFENPQDFLTCGSMVPLGGLGREKAAKADAGFKGTGLATLIELDSVIGGGPSTFIDPVTHGANRWITQTFEAWRIDTLFPREDALQQISDTIADIREYGGDDMLLPGEKEHIQRALSMSKGIAYSPKQIKRLKELGEEVGLGPLTG